MTEKTGFTIDTLRYYERIGLLHEVGRTAGGRRFFTEQDVEFLQLLRCLRFTGMPVAEMLRFVELLRSGEATREERVDVLREHEARVAAQIARRGSWLSRPCDAITRLRTVGGDPHTPRVMIHNEGTERTCHTGPDPRRSTRAEVNCDGGTE